MSARGEISVFLSLILVCILSLLMGLLESARTVGARLYLTMAADSAVTSVMAHYNRNLWDMYQLLFLEYESEEAIKETFQEYLDFYLEQDNLYPMKRESIEISELTGAMVNGARALEEQILAYIPYRLPDVASNLTGIAEDGARAARTGDFRTLLITCRKIGRETKKLESRRQNIEQRLKEMGKLRTQALKAADEGKEGRFEDKITDLIKEMKQFPKDVDAYEKELVRFRTEKMGIINPEDGIPENSQAKMIMDEELTAYEQVAEEAAQQLLLYQEMEAILEESRKEIGNILEQLEEFQESEESDDAETKDGPDWEEIKSSLESVRIPDVQGRKEIDKEKSDALDRLTDIMEKDLLLFVVPDGTEISGKKVNLASSLSLGISEQVPDSTGPDKAGSDRADVPGVLDQLLINEYIFLYFNSFVSLHGGPSLPESRSLDYEQEYILCGKAGDRENLSGTVERLLAIRGAMNLFYLLSSPNRKAQADGLAAVVSGGNAPVQMILSFFILALWAFGEAVVDVRGLLAGEKVMFLKTDAEWQLDLDGLLTLRFLESSEGERGTHVGSTSSPDIESASGSRYEDYLRILFFLQKRQERNFRMLDLIQWNVRKKQSDFSIEDCACSLEIKTTVRQRHLFMVQEAYISAITAVGGY